MTTATLPQLSALGRELDLGPDRFGFLRESNDVLDDPVAQRSRLAEDGYLYIRDFFDPALILAGRRAVFQSLATAGVLQAGTDPMEGILVPAVRDAAAASAPTHDPKRDSGKLKIDAFRFGLAAANPEIQRVVFGPEICDFYAAFFGEPIRHFDHIWTRLMGRGHGTPSHCDWVYMGRGSAQLMTCWIPYVDVPLEVGGLILLEKSHLQRERIAGYLNKDVDTYCENKPKQVQAVAKDGNGSFPGWLSQRPDTLPEKFGTRWLTSERYRVGDFLTFRMDLIHGSLDNQSDRLRFSSDTRYQPASHPADERWIGVNPPGHSLAGKRGRIC